MDAVHYLSRRLPRCTRKFFRPMRCLLSSSPAQSPPVRTCRFTAHSSSGVQLDAHPSIRSYTRLCRGVPRPHSSPPRSTARPEHTPQAPPTSPHTRLGYRAALHALRAFNFSSDRCRVPAPGRARADTTPPARRRPPILPSNRDAPRLPFHSRNYFTFQPGGGVTYRGNPAARNVARSRSALIPNVSRSARDSAPLRLGNTHTIQETGLARCPRTPRDIPRFIPRHA